MRHLPTGQSRDPARDPRAIVVGSARATWPARSAPLYRDDGGRYRYSSSRDDEGDAHVAPNARMLSTDLTIEMHPTVGRIEHG